MYGDPGVDAELYEWSCSPLDASNGHYTLPDLGNLDDADVANISQDVEVFDDGVDIYPVPSTLNCSGTVSAVEYCYAGLREDLTYETNHPVFTLLILEQTGLTFTITDMVDVYSMPTTQKCTDSLPVDNSSYRICCDSFVLDQFPLPAPDFAFGIAPASLAVSQIGYPVESFPEFRVELYSLSTSDLDTPAVGDTFTLNDNTSRITNQTLRLLQFVISK